MWLGRGGGTTVIGLCSSKKLSSFNGPVIGENGRGGWKLQEFVIVNWTTMELTCRKCRTPLLLDRYSPHNDSFCTPFTVRPRFTQVQSKNNTRFSELEGRIRCTQCKCKLGTYNWSGLPCGCGSWVVPGFVVQKDKVDFNVLPNWLLTIVRVYQWIKWIYLE